MTATEKLTQIYQNVMAEVAQVRRENKTLAQATSLMVKHGAPTIEDAFMAEAKTRVFAKAA